MFLYIIIDNMKGQKTMKLFNTLPTSVQEDIMDTLKAYPEVSVYYENGSYHFGTLLKSNYADDYRYIGIFKDTDMYTEEERIINYMESFHEYHPAYKGIKDWKMIHDIGYDWTIKFKMENGNLVRI